MKLLTPRNLAIALAGSLLVLLAWLALQPTPLPVEIAVVDRGPVEALIIEEGRTHVHERYMVSSPVTGYQPRLRWHVGDQVRAGELLVALQPSRSTALDPRSRAEAEASAARAESALQAARTNAEGARARAEFAEREYRRLEDLFAAGTISRQQLDAAEFEFRDSQAHLESAQFSINVAEHELEAARTRLAHAGDAAADGGDRIEIHAPTDGIVLAVPQESEAAVVAGQPLLEIGNPETLEVQVDLLTTEAVRLAPGMPVRLVRWGGSVPLQGTVRLVEPVGFTKVSALGIEEQRARVLVRIVSPREQWRKLGDGFRIEAEFITAREGDSLRVPVAAIFRQQDQWQVFAIRDGRARLQAFEPGVHGEDFVTVTGGLGAGDQVVLYPGSLLQDGRPVSVVNSPRD